MLHSETKSCSHVGLEWMRVLLGEGRGGEVGEGRGVRDKSREEEKRGEVFVERHQKRAEEEEKGSQAKQ